MKSNTRKQVMAEIVRVMVDATSKGDSAYEAALEAFPGVPTSILGEALAEADAIHVEAWWQTIERTIDVEVIRNALATAGSHSL